MKIKKIVVIFSVFFYGAMIVLTFFARKIHYTMIPNVAVSRLTRVNFEYEYMLADGLTKRTEIKQCIGIPKEIYDRNEIYMIKTGVKNGDLRTFVQKLDVNVGMENETYYEVLNEFTDRNLRIVVESDRELHDGDEVVVVK